MVRVLPAGTVTSPVITMVPAQVVVVTVPETFWIRLSVTSWVMVSVWLVVSRTSRATV